MTIRILVLCAAVLGVAAPSRADRLVLNNGDVLSGTVTEASSTTVEFKTDLIGSVAVPWTAIQQLSSEVPLHVERQSAAPVDGSIQVVDGRLFVSQKSDGARVNLASADIRAVQPAAGGHDGSPQGPSGWDGSINGDLSFSRGNTDAASMSFGVTATRLAGPQKLSTYGTYIYSGLGAGSSRTTLSRTARGGARYDRDVSRRTFVFGFGDVENDPIQLLDVRTVLGGGAGVHLLKNTRARLNLFGGVSAARDRYATVTTIPGTTAATTVTTPPGNSQGRGRSTSAGNGHTVVVTTGTPPTVVRSSDIRAVAEYVIGQDLETQLSDRFSLFERSALYPAVSNTADYRSALDVTFSAQLTSHWAWHVTASDRYLRIPPSGGALRNDLFLSSGLGLTLGTGSIRGYDGADLPSGRSK